MRTTVECVRSFDVVRGFDAEDDRSVVDDEGAGLGSEVSVITADAGPAGVVAGAEPCGGAEEPVGGVVTFTVCLEATTLEQLDGAARETHAARAAARLGVERARVRVGALARAASSSRRRVACAAAELTSLARACGSTHRTSRPTACCSRARPAASPDGARARRTPSPLAPVMFDASGARRRAAAAARADDV